MEDLGILTDEEALPTTYAYRLTSRIFATALPTLFSVPLLYVLVFLVTHLPDISDLGPLFVVILFLLTPPVFMLLKFGHYFRRFEVQPRHLDVSTLWMHWSVEWRNVTRIIRRGRRNIWGDRSYKVRVRVEAPDGRVDWVDLFDSVLPEADRLYAQLLRHVSHIKPKEIEDDSYSRRFLP
jgi:hypothetical protein